MSFNVILFGILSVCAFVSRLGMVYSVELFY